MPKEQYSFERYLHVRSAYAPSFSHDGKRLSFLTNITGVTEVWSVQIDIHAAKPAWPEQLTFRGERVASASYSPVADVLLVSADVGGNERDQLYILSGDGAVLTALTSQPETIYRFGGWSLDGSRIIYSSNEKGYSRLLLYDISKGWDARIELPVPDLPKGIYGVTWSKDGLRLAIEVYRANAAPDVWVWDVQEQIFWRATYSSLGGIRQESFVEPSIVHYPTFDGRQIPAFLYLPHDKQPQALPVVIHVHGGPEGQSRPEFDPVVQYLATRGYAVLKPNVRGSTGYGYEYQSLDDVRLRMDSVADLQHAVFWLRESGIADPKRIAVMAGSYGGFMVLSAVTTYPDLWTAAVDIVGIANFVKLNTAV